MLSLKGIFALLYESSKIPLLRPLDIETTPLLRQFLHKDHPAYETTSGQFQGCPLYKKVAMYTLDDALLASEVVSAVLITAGNVCI